MQGTAKAWIEHDLGKGSGSGRHITLHGDEGRHELLNQCVKGAPIGQQVPRCHGPQMMYVINIIGLRPGGGRRGGQPHKLFVRQPSGGLMHICCGLQSTGCTRAGSTAPRKREPT